MNELLKLKDIKPNVPVNLPNHNLIWIFLLLIGIAIFLIIFLFIKKQLKIKKEKQKLFSLIKEPKKFAYEFTKKAKKYKTPKNEILLEKINMRLEKYKYKPSVQNIDEQTIQLIKKYLEIK